jgi:hypothetical protein
LQCCFDDDGMGKNKLLLFTYLSLAFTAASLICACNASSDHATVDSAKVNATSKIAIQQEAFPPTEFINDLKVKASDIVLVSLTRVDSVGQAFKVFSGKVIETYKGNSKINASIAYTGMSEKMYQQHPVDTVIVFLVKHKVALTSIKIANVYYSTIEENAVLKPTTRLDSLLKKP